MKRRSNLGVLALRLRRIESKCDRILERIPVRSGNGNQPTDELIERMRMAAEEMERNARSDLHRSDHGL